MEFDLIVIDVKNIHGNNFRIRQRKHFQLESAAE